AAGSARRFDVAGGGTLAHGALAGSRVSIRVEGLDGAWHVETPADVLVPPEGRAVFTLETPGSYRVMQGARRIAAIELTAMADRPPVIRFNGDPAVTPASALR